MEWFGWKNWSIIRVLVSLPTCLNKFNCSGNMRDLIPFYLLVAPSIAHFAIPRLESESERWQCATWITSWSTTAPWNTTCITHLASISFYQTTEISGCGDWFSCDLVIPKPCLWWWNRHWSVVIMYELRISYIEEYEFLPINNFFLWSSYS